MTSQQNPYESPKADLGTTKEYAFAGFWLRLVAVIIDVIILAVISLPILYFGYGQDYFLSDEMVKGPLDVFISYIFPIVFTVALWVKIGGTPGKRILGLRVVDEKTGQNVSVGQACLRYVAYLISALPLLLGYFWVAFDKRKKSWHDHISSTVVVKD